MVEKDITNEDVNQLISCILSYPMCRSMNW